MKLVKLRSVWDRSQAAAIVGCGTISPQYNAEGHDMLNHIRFATAEEDRAFQAWKLGDVWRDGVPVPAG